MASNCREKELQLTGSDGLKLVGELTENREMGKAKEVTLPGAGPRVSPKHFDCHFLGWASQFLKGILGTLVYKTSL